MLYRFARFLLRLLFYSVFRLQVLGRDNIPREGAVILCANHTSYLDPPILGTPLKRKVHYMAKAELFHIPLLGWLITRLGAFPVKRGGVSKESIRLATQLLESGHMLGVFPEGSRRNTGAGKKGAASLALRSNAAVVPVAIIGRYVPFRTMRIVYGSPLDLTEFVTDRSADRLERATEQIMLHIRNLLAAHS